jgi:hypothetical protein
MTDNDERGPVTTGPRPNLSRIAGQTMHWSDQPCPECGTVGSLIDGRRGDDVFGYCTNPACNFEY